MTEEAAEFYSNRAEKFAERHSIENAPESYVRLLSKFSDLVGSGKVLDAGCGPGRDVRYFSKEGFDVVGVDASEKMIEEARKRSNKDYRVMSVEDLDFDDEMFDGVWCNTVLIFFDEDGRGKVLKELKRVLKKDSIIHLGLKEGKGTFTRKINGNSVKQYLMSEKEVRDFLENNGFEILDMITNETDEDFNFLNVFARRKE